MDIILIAAVTMDGFIARHSKDPLDWSKDLNLFYKQTIGHTVIMGSNTEKSIANKLIGRKVIVVHRTDKPKKILEKIKDEKCFIIGGGKTNALFARYLTHLYLTIHPMIFGKGIHLFDGLEKELTLKLLKKEPVIGEKGIYQFQYKVTNNYHS